VQRAPAIRPASWMGGFSPVRFQGRYFRRAFLSTTSASCRAVCLRPSCTPLPVPPDPRTESRGAVRWCTTVQVAIAALPQGSSLQSGLCCPGSEEAYVHHRTFGATTMKSIYVAAKPAAVLADERSARETRPVVPVAIPGDGAGDQSVESPGVKVLVGKDGSADSRGRSRTGSPDPSSTYLSSAPSMAMGGFQKRS